MVEMKRAFKVEWYEFDLTQPRCRKFFTETAASMFAWWLNYKHNIKARLTYETASFTD